MGYSSKIIQNGYQKENGCTALYMRILIDRKKKLIPLNIDWPQSKFNKEAGLCEERGKKDPDKSDYNLMIRDALAKANEIFKYYRLTNQPITITSFWKEYNTNLSKADFIKYYDQKAKLRMKDGEIAFSTYEDHMKTKRKLQLFQEIIPFADLNENWAFEFEAFLKKSIKSRRGDSTNVRWSHHKNLKTYLSLARKDHIKMINPYEYFSSKQIPGTWKPIYETDVKKLWEFYGNKSHPETQRRAVRGFLFMCFTGIRVSDLLSVTQDWLKDGAIEFLPQKGKRFGKHNEIPLSSAAQQLWDDAILDDSRPYLFKYFPEQKFNTYIKRVQETCSIEVNLHNHVGRHTFITLFLKNGGALDIASKLAGHANVKQTMIYNHPDQERSKDQIKLMDNILKAND
jgi:integrase